MNFSGAINMTVMKTAYKYRAYPSNEQTETLNRQMFLAKELYNLLLEKSKAYYEETGKTLTEYRMNVWITQIKKEKAGFAELHSQVLQNVSKRVSDSYRHFFRRCKEKKQGKKVKVGFPRYKKFVSSLTYPQTNGFEIEKKKVELSKIGRINFVNHREIEGTIKTLTIKKTKSQEWYITISTEKENITPITNGKPIVGIDLGITNYAALSNGQVLTNAEPTKQRRKSLKRLQQRISRKKKGSRNRRKAAFNFAREYEHTQRTTEDNLHKLSCNLVHSYSFIAYEDLQIQNMMRNHHLARAIGEASWGNFAQLIQYKAESAGCVAVGVNPQYTSKMCSGCGNVQDIGKNRTYNCNRCGMSEDRDLNAAKNILERALNSASSNFDSFAVKATEGHSGSYASGDSASTPQREDASSIVESGTIFGVS